MNIAVNINIALIQEIYFQKMYILYLCLHAAKLIKSLPISSVIYKYRYKSCYV